MHKEGLSLQNLFTKSEGKKIDLPERIRSVYGDLYLPEITDKHYVIANFVTTLDGIISLNIAGLADGGAISGHNPEDAMIMGILRAISDVVIIGKGTIIASPNHLWIPEEIYPPFAEEFKTLRKSLNKPENPLTVLVTAGGNIEPFYRLFQTENIPVLILTTWSGAESLHDSDFPERIKVLAVKESGDLTSEEILSSIHSVHKFRTALIEGGPHLFEGFLIENRVDELFLTISPQIAGRDSSNYRPSIVENYVFNPGALRWANLADVRQSENHIFLRYLFR